MTRTALPGYLLLAALSAHGQTASPASGASNEQVLQTWQHTSQDGQQAVVVPQPDGSTRIEWHGGVVADVHNNRVSSASGLVNSPLTSGNFYKTVVTSDLRAMSSNGFVNYFQFGMTNSNDRSILSAYPRQINNVQIGRSGAGYSLAVGDVAPNFSSLSSALALRGAMGQVKLGDATFSGYGGVVAESWEALQNLVARNQMLRDVQGIKADYQAGRALRVFATLQQGADRTGSLSSGDSFYALPAHIQSRSAGFNFADGAYQLTGETATSSFRQEGQQGRSGHATVLDGTWRGQTVSLRAGFHDIDAKYVSLSAMASPGIKETYIGGEWSAAPWITFSTDVRNSKNSTLPSEYATSLTSSTDSGTLRATVNFGPNWPGLALGLQGAASRTVDPTQNVSRNEQLGATLNYSSPTWGGSFGYTLSKVRNEAAPYADSDTANWNISLNRAFSDANGLVPASWTLNFGLAAVLQLQHMLYGDDTHNVNYTLSASGENRRWGAFTLQLVDGYITRPGLPNLRSKAAQFEARQNFGPQSNVKLYYRKALRNINDPVAGATERVVGAQFTYTF